MRIRWLTVGLVATALAGCGKGDDSAAPTGGACAAGTEKCGCYANGTCNAGLTCLSQTCVAVIDGGGTSSTSTTSGSSSGAGGSTSSGSGGGGSSGSSSTGGAGGTGGSAAGGSTGSGGSPMDGGLDATSSAGGAGGQGGTSGPAGGAGGASGGAGGGAGTAGAGPGGAAGAGGAGGGSGGAGGSAGMGGGGAGGSGGSTVDAGPVGCKDPAIIDDFEDGDAVVCLSGTRVGVWVNDNDKSGIQLPSPFLPSALVPARGDSTRAAHTTGSGFTIWGGGISAGLKKSLEANSVAAPYDASAYRAFTFWVRGAPGTQLAVGFQTAATIPASEGGRCVETCPDPVGGLCDPDCYNPFRRVITIPINDNGSWKQQIISLNGIDLTQWRVTGQSFDPKELISILFSAVAPPASFEFWIDDVSFVQ